MTLQGYRCGVLGHNTRGCMKQGVSRRPKNLVSYKPEQSAKENDGNDENIVVEGNDNEVQDFKLLKMLQ